MSDPRGLLTRYCRQGDNGAFTRFYQQQADRLWRFLRARGCNEQGAYDLLSESFIRFIQIICKDPRSPVALLYRIAVNLHIDNYRRESAARFIESGYDADAFPGADSIPDSEHGFVRSLIKTLPGDEQNLLLMRYWIGLTHKEIAGILDMPEGTIRRQCAAALKKIKQRWLEQG